MLFSHRLFASVVVVGALAGASCGVVGPGLSDLPGGIAVARFPKAQRDLLRVTAAIDGGVLAEQDLILADDTHLSGDLALNNVAEDGTHAGHLRIYGRFEAGGGEVLLGQLDFDVDVKAKGQTRLNFSKSDDFDTCGADAPPCAARFDANRNGISNLKDLLPEDADGRSVDPAPEAPFARMAPDQLELAAATAVGAFERRLVVIENNGENSARIERIDVVGAPGLGVSLFSIDDVGPPPRRSLDGEVLGDGGLLQPTQDAFLAVTFAPTNSFFAIGAVHVSLVDVVTGVRQTANMRVLRDGDPQQDPNITAPDAFAAADLAGAAVPVRVLPVANLVSGAPIVSDNPESDDTGLALLGETLIAGPAADDSEGVARTLPADAAFLIEVPPGYRLAVSLDALASDVDIALLHLGAGDVVDGLACSACVSANAGASAEGTELLNSDPAGTPNQRLVLLLGRVDVGDEPTRVPFSLSALLSKTPEFLDDDPVAPSTGPLEGGIPVTLRGRGIIAGASVTVGGAAAQDVSVDVDSAGLALISLTLPPGSLDPGRNPATIVVQNPGAAEGGDGQAATLANAFVYQPPAPRLIGLAPPLVPIADGVVPNLTLIDGAAFSSRFGPPVVEVDGIAVAATFVDAAHIAFVPPAASAFTPALTASTDVFVRVKNSVDAAGTLGASSNGVPLSYRVREGQPPVVTSVTPDRGSTEGGDVVTIVGTDFRTGLLVFVGGLAAAVTQVDALTLDVVLPPHAGAGAVDVLVMNRDGQSGSSQLTYQVTPPSVTSLFPATIATASASTFVVLRGAGLRADADVHFVDEAGTRDLLAVSVAASAGNAFITAPQLDVLGAWHLVIDGVAGAAGADPCGARAGRNGANGRFCVEAGGAPPVIQALDPASGAAGGGTEVTLFVSGRSDARVVVGNIVLDSDDVVVTLGAPDQLRFTMPPAETAAGGTIEVRVTNDDGQSTSASFVYVADSVLTPRIDDVDPARVSGVRSQTLRLQVAGLAGRFQVLLNGVPLAATTTATQGIIEVVVPARAPGTYALTLQNDGGVTASFPLLVTGPARAVLLSSTTFHAQVAGDLIAINGAALDVDPVESVLLRVAGGTLATRVVDVADQAITIEMPAVATAATSVLEIHFVGDAQPTLLSPPITGRQPQIHFVDVGSRAASGNISVVFVGDALNPARLETVLLAPVGGGPPIPCGVDANEIGETSGACVTLVPPRSGVDYAMNLVYDGTFAGQAQEVTISETFVIDGGADGGVGLLDPLVLTPINALPDVPDLSGFALLFGLPGAALGDAPGTLRISDDGDSALVLGAAVVVAEGVIGVVCGPAPAGPLGFGLYQAQLFDQNDVLVATTTGATLEVATPRVDTAPLEVTWPAPFVVAGILAPLDGLAALRVDEPDFRVDLTTTPTTDGGLSATSSRPLGDGDWLLCTPAQLDADACDDDAPTIRVQGLAAQLEPNDDDANASAIRVGSSATGTLSASDVIDSWFLWGQPRDPVRVDVEVLGCTAGQRPTVTLRRRGNAAPVRAATAPQGRCVVEVALPLDVVGDWVIDVRTATAAQAASYALRVENAPTDNNGDDVPGGAAELLGAPGPAGGGTLGAPDLRDHWVFTVPEGSDEWLGVLEAEPCDSDPVLTPLFCLDAGDPSTCAPLGGRSVVGVGCVAVAVDVDDPGRIIWRIDLPSGNAPLGYTFATISSTCGDGFIEGAEECDDLNRADADGCSSACLIED